MEYLKPALAGGKELVHHVGKGSRTTCAGCFGQLGVGGGGASYLLPCRTGESKISKTGFN